MKAGRQTARRYRSLAFEGGEFEFCARPPCPRPPHWGNHSSMACAAASLSLGVPVRAFVRGLGQLACLAVVAAVGLVLELGAARAGCAGIDKGGNELLRG